MQITKEKRTQIESKFEFFKQLDNTFVNEFLNNVQLVKVPAGQTLCRQKEECSQLGLVLSGRVRVYKLSESGKEISLYRVNPGESCVLTASCILSDIRFPAFATTETEVEALMVPYQNVNKWMNECLPWQRFIFGLVAQRLSDVIEIVEEVAFKRMDNRIAKQLLFLKPSQSQIVDTTHQQLADELGSSREVISRILKDFENRSLVKVLRGKVEIVNTDKLQELSIGE